MDKKDLSALALKYGSDKHGHHYYTQHYEKLLAPYKEVAGNMLEIGIGGYETAGGGCSLKMWKDWFTKMEIHGIDIFDKRHLQEEK